MTSNTRAYLSNCKVCDAEVSCDVTIWNLLTHTSGWEGQVAERTNP